jgi:hypothetical protein
VTERIIWNPPPDAVVRIEHLPVDFVREIDARLAKHGPYIQPSMWILDAPLFRIRRTFPQLTNRQCALLWAEWLDRYEATLRGQAIAAAALADVSQFSDAEREQIRRGE